MELLIDKETLTQKLEASADYLNKKVQETDSGISNAIKNEWEAKKKSIEDGQHSRNRMIVKEIVDTCRTFLSEIEDEVAQLKGDPDDDN